MRSTTGLFFLVIVSSFTPWRCDALTNPLSVLRPVGWPLSKLDDAVDRATSPSLRGGGNPQQSPNTGSISQGKRRQMVVFLVATALFNDMLQVREWWTRGVTVRKCHRRLTHANSLLLQLTMLLPIIHTLITSLGIKNKEVALGLFFASKVRVQLGILSP